MYSPSGLKFPLHLVCKIKWGGIVIAICVILVLYLENLRLLTEETRGWLKVHMVGSAEYFKMDKTDINKVCQRLELKLKDEQEM